jgi:pyrroline-5-carboxylate reductase
MKILIIGGGNMGLTFARSFLATHIVIAENMFILEKSIEKAEELKKQQVGSIFGEPGNYISEADLIILAVKPQDIKDLFAKIAPYVDPQQVVLSIMAGVTMQTISTYLGTKKIVRAMPNLPAQIGVGMTVYTSADDVTRVELVTVQNILNATGKAIYVEDESMIDAATAVSGSGPAYIFYYMQHLIQSAVNLGFSQSQAEMMAYETFRGAVELYNKFDFSCQEWINKVSSKGGTTEAAIKTMDEQSSGLAFEHGVMAAFKRARELSEG